MKDEFVKYLESIGLNGAPVEKAKSIYDFYSKYLSYDIEDIFVSEYVNADGSRNYESLWLFNNDYCFESKFFITENDFDSDKIKENVDCFNIKLKDYDIVQQDAKEASRMNLLITLKTNRICDFKASKENCNKLSGIFLKYYLPNYKED